VTRLNRRTLLVALAAAALGLAPTGCGSGRPPGVADQPGESYVELTDLAAELIAGTELKIKVHYRFPDGLPHPDARFCFLFDVNGGKSGTMPVRKQGRELNEDGDIEASTSAVFLRKQSVSFGVRVQQSQDKGVTWRDVSDRLSVDF
jgi:hypothetical protein